MLSAIGSLACFQMLRAVFLLASFARSLLLLFIPYDALSVFQAVASLLMSSFTVCCVKLCLETFIFTETIY